MKESHRRSLVKTVTYRILGASVTAVIGWYISGSFELGLTLGTADTVAKFGLYYFHERAWARIPLGLDDETETATAPAPAPRPQRVTT